MLVGDKTSLGRISLPVGWAADCGTTWGPEHPIAPIVLADDARYTDCGYPSSWEIAPGKIVTVYYQVDDMKNAPASAKAKALAWSVPEIRNR